ncbi:MAG: efflux RND transporter periplasmic adaptor subunit [Anaerolineales bacterium]|nr:efflux RND transporter periplasmic adaptor subunit [Anaerolineales bacterium]
MNNKYRIPLGIIIVLALSSLGYWGYIRYAAPIQETPSPQVVDTEKSTIPTIISAEGKVVPFQYAHLSFRVPGFVEQTYVKKGNRVKKGTLLAHLENQEQLEAAVAAANLEYVSAKQALLELYDKHDLALAQAQQTVAESRSSLDEAQRTLDNLNATASESDLEAARAGVALAEKILKEAQDLYNQYSHKPENNAKRAAARLALAAAQKQYDFIVRQLNYLEGTPNDITIERAEANLALAHAQLDDAEKTYKTLQNGPDPDDVELAKARLDNADAALKAAHAALDDLELRAPFSGVIISFDVKEGESVSPGIPLVLLADLSTWQVETTDLAESDVASLREGMKATVTLDAFPDKSFEGVITEISLLGEDRRGSVTYTVSLTFDPDNVPVRWGMTAFVDITLP